MPIDIIMREAKGMSDEDLMDVANYMRIIKIVSVRTTGKGTSVVSGNGKPVLRKAGKRKGQIRMTEDFDAPLEDFKEYM